VHPQRAKIYTRPTDHPSRKHHIVVTPAFRNIGNITREIEFPYSRNDLISDLLSEQFDEVTEIIEVDLISGTAKNITRDVAEYLADHYDPEDLYDNARQLCARFGFEVEDEDSDYSDPYAEHRLTACDLGVGRFA